MKVSKFTYDLNYSEPKKVVSQRKVNKTKRVALYVILFIMAVIWLFPFVYLVGQSFAKVYVPNSFFPSFSNFTFDNYVALFDEKSAWTFWTWWKNTMIIAVISSLISTTFVLLTSYGLSRLRFKLRPSIMKLFLILGMFPGFIGIVVVYFILKSLGLSGSIYSLIIVYTASSGMGYFIAKGYFDTIPRSLDEAAMIDGANKNTIFWRVILPLAKPIIVYSLLLSFVGPWGDFMMASYLAGGNSNNFNVAVGLQQMITKEAMGTHFTTFCAGGVLTSIPIMALFFGLQRFYVEGVTGGSVKG